MSSGSIRTRLTAIIHEVFEDDAIEVTGLTSMDDVPVWDSVNHMALIAATEKAFAIQFTLSELVGIRDVMALEALIRVKIPESAAGTSDDGAYNP